ncbi:winged helix-turn-helix domain-containing protein [Photobacterium phosphoreum]|uniref:winged helix-turn-helix domain-containing protein n=1 Tax=Photobacterium phosphoreum TaxID=659 RepID=UPI000D152635|nr:hypothetical protein CTM80_14715 [Photobacterium phosphoreum]
MTCLKHFKEGKSRTQIAKYLKVSRTSVNKWVSVFLEEGLEKLRSGRPAFLTPKQRGRLIGADIHAYILKEFDKNDHPDSIYYLLKHMEFSWITSQSKHPKKSQQAQDNFKNLKLKRSLRSLDI